ncbi:PaaI family thioesterase [Nocardioides sp. URHA0020]|uniref:PaaI family thioesterase n=1 Tax=Nocardioides sp. URHA0020 TaxID=1380392 RepID=UPI00048F0427|nr:PaaI family thioesterase [Nocardioides sp. URHA0020]
MAGDQREPSTAEQVAREASLYGPFTDVVRELVDATIRTEIDDAEVAGIQTELASIVARLRTRQLDGPYAVNNRGRHWGNTVVGLRNAIAPPLHIERESTGRAWSSFHLGAAYEGPPGLVHGGVSALVLDQMLGEATGAGGKPGMTASLTLTYRRATALGDLRAEAWIERTEGIKTWARGHLSDADGVTVEAEGLFILPRWAREKAAAQPPPSFE